MPSRFDSRLSRLCLTVALGLASAQVLPAASSETDSQNWSVYFSPKGGCTDAIVRALGNARNTVLVQAYSFTSAPVAKALLDAHKRGVKISAILDKSQRSARYSSAQFMVNQGIPPLIDAAHAIAHNKVMVIDDETVITGSFNFSKAAEEQNAENLLVIRDRDLAALYTANWQEHARHSEPYTEEGHQRAPLKSRRSP